MIEEDIKEAITEFGEEAYKRFTDDCGLEFGNNSELLNNQIGFYPPKLKPIADGQCNTLA